MTGRVVITLAALKRPAPSASRMPRLTPGDSAKSSAQRQNENYASAVPMVVSRPEDGAVRTGMCPASHCETVWLQALSPGNPEKARSQSHGAGLTALEIGNSARWR